MYRIKMTIIVIVFAAVAAAMAQSQEPQPLDSRLPVHTIVREDIFAGFLMDDMERFTKGEKNLDLLLEKRPNEKAGLLAWKGGAALYRAVRAFENKRNDEFQQYYKRALDFFAQARQVGPQDGGVIAVTGGSYAVFADRLPQEYRAAAWSQAYDSYQMLWKFQASSVEKLPVHLRGELLAGLVQSAQRTGHMEEMQQYLDKMLLVLSNTAYEPIAKQWKKNPASAANSSITCLTCHESGRLAPRTAALNKQ